MSSGRTITQRGYVLIRVGKDHHLADVRGYAYEHRLVAEQEIGRFLDDREEVHHINGDRSDNRPSNLEVMSASLHRQVHRPDDCNKRLPSEENPEIKCACGCGATLPYYDSEGRPRTYVYGHQLGKPTQQIILSALELGPTHIDQLVEHHGNRAAVYKACHKLLKKGDIVRVKRGVYAKP